MRIINRANLSPEQLIAIENELPMHDRLLDVINWGRAQRPGVLLPQVVAGYVKQDEFTHDVIVPWRNGLVLVYDTT